MYGKNGGQIPIKIEQLYYLQKHLKYTNTTQEKQLMIVFFHTTMVFAIRQKISTIQRQ